MLIIKFRVQFTEAVVNLKFDEDPKYSAYSSLFEPLCGATPARPILQTDAPKVMILVHLLLHIHQLYLHLLKLCSRVA